MTYYADTTKDTTVDSSEIDYSANSQFYLTGTMRESTTIRSFDRGTIVVDL